MTTRQTPEAIAAREAQAKKDHRRKIIRTIIGRGGAYGVLIGFAVAMLFPFLFMVASALKTPEDTFRYPPKILPRTAATAEVGGEEVDLYSAKRQRSERLSLGTLTLPEGPSNLMFKLIGKNDASEGLGFDLITIQCDRVE